MDKQTKIILEKIVDCVENLADIVEEDTSIPCTVRNLKNNLNYIRDLIYVIEIE